MTIKRSIFNRLCDEISKPEILILLGARQVGKTTLLKELKKYSEKIEKKTNYYNLEFPDDLYYFSKTEDEIIKELSFKKNQVIFIDEFHYLKNASKIFKSLYDLELGIKIIVSGSSSIDVHKHLKESLAGRRKIVKIFPFNLDECSRSKIDLENIFIYGGMPGLLKLNRKNDKIEYLSQIVQTYILKDIKGLIKDENIRAFNHLLFYLAEHQGSVLPSSNIANEIGLSAKTIENYLEILDQTFVIYSVCSYSKSLANELKKSKKYYFYDLGIRNSFLKDFKEFKDRSDQGVLLESIVLHELKNIQKANVDIRFWRTKQNQEVDFLWIEDRIITPIEVKVTAKNDRIPNGIINICKNYPEIKKAYIVCLDREEEIFLDKVQIKYIHPKKIKFSFEN